MSIRLVTDKGQDKLAAFDSHAHAAVTQIRHMLDEYQDEIVSVARARHILGHFRYADTLMYEYDAGRLRAEIIEELADAVVYEARVLELKG